MPHRLFMLILALACFSARFHCALEESGLASVCCDHGHGHEHDEAPHHDGEGCPDLESNSTSLARKTVEADPLPALVNLWATRHFTLLLRLDAPGFADDVPPAVPPALAAGPHQALASCTISLRGPPAHA